MILYFVKRYNMLFLHQMHSLLKLVSPHRNLSYKKLKLEHLLNELNHTTHVQHNDHSSQEYYLESSRFHSFHHRIDHQIPLTTSLIFEEAALKNHLNYLKHFH